MTDLNTNMLSVGFAEELYREFTRDPAAVPPDWRKYFESFPAINGSVREARSSVPVPAAPTPTAPSTRALGGNGAPAAAVQRFGDAADLQHRVEMLVRNYRVRGHIAAQLDPLGQPRPTPVELDPAFHGLSDSDLDCTVSPHSLAGGAPHTLRELIARLQNTYCRSIAVQFMHIDDIQVRQWLQERMEGSQNRIELSRKEQIRILTRLMEAMNFESFLQKKFVGAKSFSLEGAETLIPLMDVAIEYADAQGIREIVIGMAHRGRLNVLANIMGKEPAQIFREFEDIDPQLHRGRGDVKYHLGYHNDWEAASGRSLHLSLCFNPSHLEFVNPVALGRVRAKQDRFGDLQRRRAMCMLIHGDAAFAGEGIVQETLNLSQLPGYSIGGTLHVIVNNQIGFTTGPSDARSGLYCTDVAKLLQIPIFHVNGEDPEAVVQVVHLAMDFRLAFQRDVVIDMYCYRRRGHNESDEPAFTQPVLYQAIAKRKSVQEGYFEHLLKLGGVTQDDAEWITSKFRERLEDDLKTARSQDYSLRPQTLTGVWSQYVGGHESSVQDVETGVPHDKLAALLEAQTRMPADFHPHPKLKDFFERRREMAAGARPLDWSAAEALAFATLATQGTRVRLTGQDSGRGTFTHRHAVLHDYRTGAIHVPLQHLHATQAPVEIYDSPLSEAGVLGFEYGYSIDYPDALLLWEAQFGDFVNAAQVIIDQFISSAEAKWQRLSGVVMLLPHAFEGQGPEHSSARLERFLNLCADDNIQVVYPSTPAQYFHLLRRQAVRPWRKPLVVMTPKSMLRSEVSPIEEFTGGKFQRVIADSLPREAGAKVDRILLCSGKISFELEKRRSELKRDDVAILRVEQLYPLPTAELTAALKPFADNTPAVWVQEEPENQGAWRFMRIHYGDRLLDRFPMRVSSRPPSASPATGSGRSHKLEQEQVVAGAFE
ncbi:MAG: 2-oxoglutarate dehydrogenase E1 component [Phycisphaerae bacterium]